MSSSAIETSVKWAAWPTTVATPIKQGIARIAARRELHRAVKDMLALDDRILRDIGLSRDEVELAARFGRSFDRYKDHLR